MPPARRTDENCIIFRQCLFIKQIRYSGAQVIIGFMLNAVAVIVRICSIRFGSLNAMDICACKFHDTFGNGLGVSFGRKVEHKHIAVSGWSIGSVVGGRACCHCR